MKKNQRNPKSDNRYEIVAGEGNIILRAGFLTRTITIDSTNLISTNLLINGNNVMDKQSNEFAVSFYAASPNAKPVGIKEGDVKSSLDEVGTDNLTDVLKYKQEKGFGYAMDSSEIH